MNLGVWLKSPCSVTTILQSLSEMKTRGQEGLPPPQPRGMVHSVRDYKEASEEKGRKGSSEFGRRDESIRIVSVEHMCRC